MRIYITGSKGQLGRALMRRLAHHDLLGVDLPEVDLTDLAAARSSLAAFQPDVIIHAAAYTDVDGAARNPDLAYRVNALGTRNVAVAGEATGAALLAISTNEVFDGAKNEPYLEFDPPHPINPYARSKLAAEQFVRDLTTRFTIVRTAWLYGLGGNHFVKKIITRADTDGRLRVVADEVSSPTYAEDLVTAIEGRRSHRRFLAEPLTLEEVSFLLWATQGIRHQANAATAFRNVPSAGCRHALETYLGVLNVTGLAPGLYRYLPVEHRLLVLERSGGLRERLTDAALHQHFIGQSAATFIWTTVPYRMEWRYGLASHKVIALDAGHVCQNLYLACSAVGCGTCAVAAYHQEMMDRLLGVDGEEEFTLYLAPVGKVGG